MNLFEELAAAAQAAEDEYEEKKKGRMPFFTVSDSFGTDPENIICLGDNLDFMRTLPEKSADFIYIDPPFFSGSDYSATLWLGKQGKSVKPLKAKVYTDNWEKGLCGFLTMMGSRLYFMRDILKDSGTIAVHLDWHAVHYVKALMDSIFGVDNFVNEIIWSYKSGGYSGRGFAKKHDTILVYSKSKKYYFKAQKEKSYNRGYKPYHFKNVEEFEDELGWYTLVNRKDVLNVNMVGRTSSERTGYATQKPEQLTDILLASFCPEGGLACDFFCGSGTLAASAAKAGIKYCISDLSPVAAEQCIKRLGSGFKLLVSDKYSQGAFNPELCDFSVRGSLVGDCFVASESGEFVKSWDKLGAVQISAVKTDE